MLRLVSTGSGDLESVSPARRPGPVPDMAPPVAAVSPKKNDGCGGRGAAVAGRARCSALQALVGRAAGPGQPQTGGA